MQPDQHSSHTTIGAYVQAISTALESRGIDPHEVFAAAGIDPHIPSDPLRRMTETEVAQLYKVAVSRTNDPYFGIAVGMKMQPGLLHALGFSLMLSATLRDFFQRVSQHYRLASQLAEFYHYDEDNVSVLGARNIRPGVCFETQDVWVVLMMRYMRTMVDENLDPVWVELQRDCPNEGDAPYIELFKCPVRFGCVGARIAIDRAIVDKALPGASRELALQNDEVVMRYLAELDRNDLVNRVRSIIVRDLAPGNLRKEHIAAQLHMSSRNLQLKLAVRGTNFQDLLDQTRHTLAMGYIEQSRLAITEISYLQRISDLSNFTRAFKRWTGKSPSAYRDTLAH